MWRCSSQPSTRGDGRSLHQKQKSGLSGRHTRRVPPQVKVRATTNPIIQCCSGIIGSDFDFVVTYTVESNTVESYHSILSITYLTLGVINQHFP